MLRPWLSGAVVLTAALAAAAEEPAWKRVLQGEDAQKAEQLQKRIGELEAADKYMEAVPLARELAQLREKSQGAEHWQARDARRRVQTLEQIAGLPAEQWRRLREAASLGIKGDELGQRAKYAEAEPLYRRALAIREEVLGAKHHLTADSYNNLAYNLDRQGQHAEAEPLHRRALAIKEQALGPNHLDTADSCNGLATNLNGQGQYAEAEPLFRKALAIREHVLGARHPSTAVSCNNLAGNLDDQGRYLDRQSKYAEAEVLYRRALAVFEQALGPNHLETAASCGNLALNLDRQGKHAEAEALQRRALVVREQALGPNHPHTATSCNNLARNLDRQGKHAQAEPLYRLALAAFERALGPHHPDTARSYNNLALNLDAQGKPAEAEREWRAAVTAYEVTRLRLAPSGFDRAVAAPIQPHAGLSLCLARQGKGPDAWQAAEAGLARGLLDDLALPADAVPRAAERRRRAVRLEQLDTLLLPLLTAERLSADERKRRDALAGERDGLRSEIDTEAAQLAAERILPRGDIQGQLAADAALVLWLDGRPLGRPADAGGWHWGCVVRRAGPPAWVRLPGSGPGGAWTDADDELPQRLREALARRAPGWSKLARRLRQQRLDPLEKHLGSGGNLPEVRQLIAVPAGALAGVPLAALSERWRVSYAPSGTLFARLAAGHRPLRQPTLLALGDPVFTTPQTPPAPEPPGHGLLVLQVLPGGNADKAGVRPDDVLLEYAGTKLTSRDDLKLRAEGGPVPLRLWRGGKERSLEVAAGKLGVVLNNEPAPAALKRRRELEQLLASTRGPVPKALPGTRREVQALAALLPKEKVRLLLGSEASEQRLDQLAAAGKLKDYRLLHFATHGALDSDTPARSALLLATDRLPDAERQAREGQKVYTGRLTVGTVLGWKLDADLVTLSACETGLGRQAGGEGLLGFVQALVQAGARAVLVSLWPVDDAATALLMTRFYENLLGQRQGLKAPLGKAEALAEAKQWLRRLPRPQAEALAAQLSKGEVRLTVSPLKPAAPAAGADKGDRPYAHPYYWSAFVLLGDPD
jgi:CHAT domain-containing protein/Tfp pilus assembly protein PilF